MDQAIRNKLRNVVTQCRKLLEEATSKELQGRFGIYPSRDTGPRAKDIVVEDDERMAHLTDEDRACRQDLLDHLEHIHAIGYKPSETLEQLVREIAFTHLNRLCAYKMMETRGLIREAVSRGLKSQGFFFYLSDHPEDEKLHNSGQQDVAYRNFLDWLGGTLSQEIGVLFNPNDPANRIYPPQRVLDDVLALINDGELSGIWSLDETIGWVYQYFTPKELRDKARKESRSPRNSYELAFRNQFFTPRYVVEFLTDNTLGRIWYEMRKGKTVLKDHCRYLVRRPTEIFLKEGAELPAESKEAREDLSQEKLLKLPVHIPHRPKKDPRAIKVLDPACGSGHFLLYCFDLLQIIYEEAYDDPNLSAALRRDYPAIEDLRHALPGLILKHNLHGIDIDLRATQIAALALWLRCQRAYQELGLNNGERPTITRSNIACAEPMPGETDLLKEFTATLQPKVLGQLVEVVFEKMKLAGEAGSLLKIEKEIQEAARKAKYEYIEWKKHQEKVKGFLFPEMITREQPNLFDFADLTDEAFLDRADEEIVTALRKYAEHAANGRAFRRRLFAEDAARGFAFIDICRNHYDAILMNPPFGASSLESKNYIEDRYPNTKGDVLVNFVERTLDLADNQGRIGAISSRTPFFLGSFESFRNKVLGKVGHVRLLADLGEGVLEAMVETAVYVLSRTRRGEPESVFFRLLIDTEKGDALKQLTTDCFNGFVSEKTFIINPANFDHLNGIPYAYWVSQPTIKALGEHPRIEGNKCAIRVGMQTGDDFRFLRCLWEVSSRLVAPSPQELTGTESPRQRCLRELSSNKAWVPFSKTETASPWFSPITLVAKWAANGAELRNFTNKAGKLRSALRSEQEYFKPGFSYMLRSTRLVPYLVPAGVMPTAGRAQIFPDQGQEYTVLGICASNVGSAIARFSGEKFAWPKFQASMVQGLPACDFPEETLNGIKEHVDAEVNRRRAVAQHYEPFQEFTLPAWIQPTGGGDTSWNLYSLFGRGLETSIAGAFGLSSDQLNELERDIREAVSIRGLSDDVESEDTGDESNDDEQELKIELISETPEEKAVGLFMYGVGIPLGRWDVRFAQDPSLAPKLSDPFDPLPVCQPGMLVSPEGLPAEPGRIVSKEWLRTRPDANTLPPEGSVENPIVTDTDYPIRIDWNGILVDDPGHEDDIVRRVREVLEVIWKERAEAIEKEACEILGVRELRDYFRKPGNGGFWVDHVKRYSKSRRKAPIYWYLRSAKGNYGLWLYYHRLDKDILFKALLNYVEPKIRLEENRLKTLRGRKEAAGNSGREAKQIEMDMDRQEQFVSELHDFKDKLRRAADLHLEPDLNDGVVLNIAPLWELVPWKEAKEYWEELVEGKYEWSSIGKYLREKGWVK